MCLLLSEWSDESSAVILEAFFFGHILGSGVLGDCLEERVQQGVVVLARVDCLEADVLDA